MRTVKRDLQEAIGPIQLCTGQAAECEAAVHAMKRIFTEEDTEAMILVDASYKRIQPTEQTGHLDQLRGYLSCYVTCSNTYRSNSWLFIDGRCRLSKEGTTQGDPLAMAMYAIGSDLLLDDLIVPAWRGLKVLNTWGFF